MTDQQPPLLDYRRPESAQAWPVPSTDYAIPEKPRRCAAALLSLCAGMVAICVMLSPQRLSTGFDPIGFAAELLVPAMLLTGLLSGLVGIVFGRRCRKVGVCGLALNLAIILFILGHMGL